MDNGSKDERTEFKVTKRSGKHAIWINKCNVWDLEPLTDTDAVRQAIMRAYFMGIRHGVEINVEAVRSLQYKANREEYNSTWKEEL